MVVCQQSKVVCRLWLPIYIFRIVLKEAKDIKGMPHYTIIG